MTIAMSASVMMALFPALVGSLSPEDVRGGVFPSPDGSVHVARRGLCISEVLPGPFLSYIEVYNNSFRPIDLDGYWIETSTGQHTLSGLNTALGPNEYFVLLQGHPDEVGVSTDPEVLSIVVSAPTCGHVTDTVLLRDPAGRVLDATSYGVLADTSPRYFEAVLAGQFAFGEFVSVTDVFGDLVLGRDRMNADTNSISDWHTSGGPDALVGSPFASNDARPSGEEYWILFYQSFLSTTVSQPYFGVSVKDASYADFAGTVEQSTAVHTLVFEGEILGPGEWPLTGLVTNHLEVLPNDVYAVESHGILTESGGRSLAFDLRREVGNALDNLQVNAVFTCGGQEYPYSLEMTRQYTGVRGDFVHTIERVLIGWSGISKTTSASQTVEWSLATDGTVASNSSSVSISRPFPLSDGWVGRIGGTPDPVVATETVLLDMYTIPTSNGAMSDWTKLEFHYDNGIPSIVGSSFQGTINGGGGSEEHVQGTVSGILVGDGQSFTYNVSARAEPVPNTKLVRWVGAGDLDGQSFMVWDSVFDPLPSGRGKWWERFKKTVKVTAQCAGTVSMLGIGSLGCAGTTAGGCALGGVTTVGTLGAATPAGVAAAGGGVIACGGLIYGSCKVIDLIWEQ